MNTIAFHKNIRSHCRVPLSLRCPKWQPASNNVSKFVLDILFSLNRLLSFCFLNQPPGSLYSKSPGSLDTKHLPSGSPLTLAELESSTSFRLTRFLTFNRTRITCHEAFRTKCRLIFSVDLNQCTGNS